MEYIQTILFQITAARLEQAAEAGGLIPELDEHRDFLKQQNGFEDLRITRSINPEGNILVVVETRWSDDNSLVRYETNEPNVASIVRKHENVIVENSLQVLDMEALRTESSWAPAEEAEHATERVTLPILIPVGVLAFALLVIYGLSRVYLELTNEGATALAAGIAIAVLLFAFYFANNPKAPGWQIAGVMVVAVAALIGGTTWALIEEDEAEGDHAPTNGEPVNGGDGNGEPGDGPGDGPGGEQLIILGDNFFEFGGQQNPSIPVPAGEEVTLDILNQGAIIHNVHVDGTNDEYTEAICEVGGDNNGCSDPSNVAGGEAATITIQIDEPGTYNFRCDFHPVEMIGTFVVE